MIYSPGPLRVLRGVGRRPVAVGAARGERGEESCEQLSKEKAMLGKVDYVMITVSDMKRSVRFYRDVLGLPLKFDSPDWTEFQTGATTLGLHGGGEARKDTRSQDQKIAGTCSIGFTVENLQATWETLTSKGVRFVMPPTAREGEGIELAVAIDPDGLPISFSRAIR
jgi:lactoylglutathione lyase